MNKLQRLKKVPYRLCLTLEYGNLLHEPHRYVNDTQVRCYRDCKLCNGTGMISGEMFYAVQLAEQTMDHFHELTQFKKVSCCHCLKTFHPLISDFKRDEDNFPLCPNCGLGTLIIETKHGRISKKILKLLRDVLFIVRTATPKKR